jgi:RecB family exonuclease
MRPMPSPAVLIGSGSARDRTPMPRPARSWVRLRTSRRLRPIRSKAAEQGRLHELLQEQEYCPYGGLLRMVLPAQGRQPGGR